ncbi:MAG TPA: protein phosphatase 2C domain-containing protein [Candidatus Xenobia bacterium]|jgi:protein phosphatase
MIVFDHAGISEQGPVRERNEDCIASHSPEDDAVRARKGSLLVVADGVSGQRGGEVASALAVQTLMATYYAMGRKPAAALRGAFEAANLRVCDEAMARQDCRRMETTLTALLLVESQAVIGHIGDTRVYRIRAGTVEQLTRDHSEVGELVRMQILTVEEAQRHPRRHIITRTVGSELLTQADYRTEALQQGDAFVLCSDGLWEPLAPDHMVEAVSESPATACRMLIERALAHGSSDNLSLHVVKVKGVPVAPAATGFLRRALSRLGAGR